MKKKSQLEWVSRLLNKYKLDWFLDSGSLLGIIRDNKLLDWDNDLDVSVKDYDERKFEKLKEEFEKENFKVKFRHFDDILGECKIYPLKDCKFDKPIDIKIFHKSKKYYWSPTIYAKNVENDCLKDYIILGLKIPFLLMLKIFKSPVFLEKITSFLFYKTGTWFIPNEYIKKTKYLEKTKIRIPGKYKKYLEFRYGKNWKKPIKKWRYTRDDKGIKLKSPCKLKLVRK